jgi:hypothetical protein
MPDDTVKFRRFPKGVDNRRADQDIAAGGLRLGENVDILNSGLARRRRGISQNVASAGAHSLFADDTRRVWATVDAIKLDHGPGTVVRTVLTDARLGSPLSWVSLHGELYFSNEDINGKINAADEYEQWGITPPDSLPLLSGSGNRIVQLTCTFVTGSGEESGAPLGTAVLCGDNAIINVTGIPQSLDPRVLYTRIYVTDLDGTEFFQQVDVPAGVTSYLIRGPLCVGQQLTTQFMLPPPPGQLIDYDNGRMLIACDRFVIHTKGLRYSLYDPTVDYVQYPERVTLLKAVEDGIYISAVDTRFVTDLGTETPGNRPVFPYRAIEGSAIDLPNSKDVMWLSERGVIRAGASGQARNLTEGQIAMSRYARACMGVFEYSGHKAAIAITSGANVPNPEVAADYLEAESTRLSEAE